MGGFRNDLNSTESKHSVWIANFRNGFELKAGPPSGNDGDNLLCRSYQNDAGGTSIILTFTIPDPELPMAVLYIQVMDTSEMEKLGGDISKLKWSVVISSRPVSFLITRDVGIVNTPDGRGIVLVGVTESTAIDGNEKNSTALLQWWGEKGKHEMMRPWTFLNMTLKVARKGAVVLPISDEVTSCGEFYLK